MNYLVATLVLTSSISHASPRILCEAWEMAAQEDEVSFVELARSPMENGFRLEGESAKFVYRIGFDTRYQTAAVTIRSKDGSSYAQAIDVKVGPSVGPDNNDMMKALVQLEQDRHFAGVGCIKKTR